MIERWRVVYNTLRPHSSPLGAAKFNFTAYGCDVDSLNETGTKTRAGQALPYGYGTIAVTSLEYALSWLDEFTAVTT